MPRYSYQKSDPIRGGKFKGKCVYHIYQDDVRIAVTRPLTYEESAPLRAVIDDEMKMESWLSALEVEA